MKRILDCQASDFSRMTPRELLDSIAASEGRVIACETIGAIMPMLGDITNAEFVSAMGADILLLNVFDVQKPFIAGVPKTEPDNVIHKLRELRVQFGKVGIELPFFFLFGRDAAPGAKRTPRVFDVRELILI